MLSERTLAYGEEVTEALLGADAVQRADLVVLVGRAQRRSGMGAIPGSPAAHRDAFLRFLYGRMHSPQSVAMFQ